MSAASRDRLLRLAFSGLNDIEEWRLGDAALASAKGYPRRFPVDVLDDSGIVFADVALDARTGELVCHEVNGPNAVGSDALTGDSSRRAEVEARQTVRRLAERGTLRPDGTLERPVATVHAHQHWSAFRTGGEFYPRVGRYADALERLLPSASVALRGPAEALGDEAISVVLGDVPSVARNLRRDPHARGLEYRERPVVFAGNPNLVPELVRVGRLRWERGRCVDSDLRAFHAWRLLSVVHDKALQQLLFEGTGIRPLLHFEADSKEEAVVLARRSLEQGPVVLKPNAGSGGTGVHVAVASLTDDELRARVDLVLADCARKYGENVEAFAFPIRGFEFVRSTGYPLDDGEHLWDLRIGVLFEPGRAEAFPVSMRLAPRPFDERTFHLDRDQWVSNVSGRQVTLLKSGMDERALAAVGMTEERVEEALRATVAWTTKAWDASVRGGGPKGAVHEDACERADAAFYPRERWSTA